MTHSNIMRPVNRGDPHDWNSLDRYLDIYRSYLDDREYFIVEDTLSERIDGYYLYIEGRITEVNDRNQVRTQTYSYHAGVIGSTPRSIFRYDNSHSYPNHDDAHHRHRFAPHTWQEIDPPEWVGRAK